FKETPSKPLSTGALMSDKDNNSSGGESEIKAEIRTASSLSNENSSPQHTPVAPAMDSSWDSGGPPDASTLPPYKSLNDYVSSPHQTTTSTIRSNKPPEPPQQQNSGGYGGNGSNNGGCVAGSGGGGGGFVGIGPCAMGDYMTANSDYGVMLPMQSLPPLSPHTSPAHAVHPLSVLNGGVHISPQHLPAIPSHQQLHKGQQQQQQLPLTHHLPVMTNNSLYATGALSAALVLPQYSQPDPNQAHLSLSRVNKGNIHYFENLPTRTAPSAVRTSHTRKSCRVVGRQKTVGADARENLSFAGVTFFRHPAPGDGAGSAEKTTLAMNTEAASESSTTAVDASWASQNAAVS
ncbi:irregular chiasm C-roughest protein-like, partial [Tropilaelaps mercedesae]